MTLTAATEELVAVRATLMGIFDPHEKTESLCFEVNGTSWQELERMLVCERTVDIGPDPILDTVDIYIGDVFQLTDCPDPTKNGNYRIVSQKAEHWELRPEAEELTFTRLTYAHVWKDDKGTFIYRVTLPHEALLERVHRGDLIFGLTDTSALYSMAKDEFFYETDGTLWRIVEDLSVPSQLGLEKVTEAPAEVLSLLHTHVADT